jgi:hypothetical protein
VLTIPEVRAHLRGTLLPIRNPQLRAVVSRALQWEQLPVAQPEGPAPGEWPGFLDSREKRLS